MIVLIFGSINLGSFHYYCCLWRCEVNGTNMCVTDGKAPNLKGFFVI